MGDMFNSIMSGAGNARDSFLGPGYDYYKSINAPSEMGMSENGSLGTLANNISGLISYVEVLVSGKGNASKTGQPLGNKFFLKTAAKCKETTIDKFKRDRANKEKKEDKDAKKVDRYIYINNVPDGTIPFISAGMGGTSFGSMKGLIPGAIGNLGALNPAQLFASFSMGSYPDCAPITMETVNNDNQRGTETRHVALIEVEDMNPCWFSNRVNPVSGKSCREVFTEQSTSNAGGQPNSFLKDNNDMAYPNETRSPYSFNLGVSTNQNESTVLYYSPFSSSTSGTINLGPASFFKSPLRSGGLLENGNIHEENQEHEDEDAETKTDGLLDRLSAVIRSLNLNTNTNTNTESGKNKSKLPNDVVAQIYYASITIIMLYIVYRVLYRKRRA
jgi:hypothetical protein